MYTHRDTSAPPTGLSSIPAARQAALLRGLLVSAPALARPATAFDRRGRWTHAS
jgi:hypothetical protein